MFVINIVYSEGLISGREVLPVIGSDMHEVIYRAYLHYKDDFDYHRSEAEDDEMSFTEFNRSMVKGFMDDDEFVLIQCDECHIQYEPTAWH